MISFPFAITFLVLVFVPCVRAAPVVEVYGYVDKINYSLGEVGELKLWLVNEGDEDLIFQNITILYPWNYNLPWEGNDSLKNVGHVILVGGNISLTFSFTVPNDGRTSGSYINIYIETDRVSQSRNIPMTVSSPMIEWTQSIDDISTRLGDTNSLLTQLGNQTEEIETLKSSFSNLETTNTYLLFLSIISLAVAVVAIILVIVVARSSRKP